MNNFDFLVGTWNSAQRKLTKRLVGSDDWEEFPGHTVCTRHFDGAANVDEVTFPTKGSAGLTLRLYDPATDLWSIYWTSSLTGKLDIVPCVGRFDGNVGLFYADDLHEGTPIRVRFTWTVHGANSCRWEQAFSVDGERTWETNWVADFTRVTAVSS